MVAAVVALAERTRLAAQPRDVILGRVPGTDHRSPPTWAGPLNKRLESLSTCSMPLWYSDADYRGR